MPNWTQMLTPDARTIHGGRRSNVPGPASIRMASLAAPAREHTKATSMANASASCGPSDPPMRVATAGDRLGQGEGLLRSRAQLLTFWNHSGLSSVRLSRRKPVSTSLVSSGKAALAADSR